jgi:hypothetical protein
MSHTAAADVIILLKIKWEPPECQDISLKCPVRTLPIIPAQTLIYTYATSLRNVNKVKAAYVYRKF